MISPEELNNIGLVLSEILQNDDTVRKAAEAKLNEAKRTDADRYAVYLIAVIHPNAQFSLDVKSLAAVMLRRNVSCSSVDSSDLADQTNNQNLWQRMSDQARTHFKTQLIEVLRGIGLVGKHLSHKICNLVVEVQGSMYEHEDSVIWQDMLNILFEFIHD